MTEREIWIGLGSGEERPREQDMQPGGRGRAGEKGLTATMVLTTEVTARMARGGRGVGQKQAIPLIGDQRKGRKR